MEKKVGIILINYKDYASRFLEDCRDSLYQQTYSKELINIYIIDNASTPETQAELKNIFPEAIILPRSDGNYAAANNFGFKQALADNCSYVVSANMDTAMDENWLKELVRALDNNLEAGIAQSKILLETKTDNKQGEIKINSLGNIIHFLGFGFTSHYGQVEKEIKLDENSYPEIKGYASGCSFIIRGETLKVIGLDDGLYYNEEFYMYHDDLELSLKVKLAGYKVILAPLSKIFHKYEFSRSTRMIYYMERNRYLTLLIFYPPWLLALIALPALIMDIGLIFYSILGGWFKEQITIHLYFFKTRTYDKIFIARKRLKEIQKTPFKLIAKNFAGRIEFQEIANPILNYLVNPIMNLYWYLVKFFI